MIQKYSELKQYLIAQFKGGVDSIHGIDHWERVNANGLLIAKNNGANEKIISLFAILHDCKRLNDGRDAEHGYRSADFIKTIRNEWLNDLTSAEFKILEYACRYHVNGQISEEQTIGACWDADRLDLPRCFVKPDSSYMSTEYGGLLIT